MRGLPTEPDSYCPALGGLGDANHVPGAFRDEFTELLRGQHGVLSRRQAQDQGLSAAAIRVRLRNGRWQRLYPGVYATFSGEPSRMALIWAAVITAGPAAVISHLTAAELYECGRRRARAIHVTIPAARRVRQAARLARSARPAAPVPPWQPEVPPLIIHRSDRVYQARHPALLPPRTRIEETIIDLTQAAATFDEAFQWLCHGCASRLCTVSMIRRALASRKKLRFRTELQLALGDVADGVHSPLEHRYVHGVERPHGLPVAKRQVQVTVGRGRRYLDNLYRDYGLAVELDGAAAHPVAERWQDIHRDNSLARLGITTLRYSWPDVTDRSCWVAAEVATVLAERGWPGQLRRCAPDCRAVP